MFVSSMKKIMTAVGTLVPMFAYAAEYPIGKPQTHAASGLEVAAVYLQPVEMEPAGMMRKAADTDVHMEADIHAIANNPNGFAEGDWVPNLLVRYELIKTGSNWKANGDFMAMVASDGPHYGDNVKLGGVGKYHLKFTIYPPGAPENVAGQHFGRHTDRQTGVKPWFKPFTVEYDFTFAGIGKKGGY
jgi:uncharacterized protein involved in high-affinity Fe2+ transport